MTGTYMKASKTAENQRRKDIETALDTPYAIDDNREGVTTLREEWLRWFNKLARMGATTKQKDK